MSLLVVYSDSDPNTELLRTEHAAAISAALSDDGVRFEQWEASAELPAGAKQENVIAAYRGDVDRLMRDGGYKTVDVVRLAPKDNPTAEEAAHYAETARAARQKFLKEHRHAEDEVRFFVEGSGLFYLHLSNKVFCLLCEQGDLVSVPDSTPHWFDMGTRPYFAAIRLFNNPEGWVAEFTGSDISTNYIDYDGFVAMRGAP